MFGLETFCHFGRFYSSASAGVRGPGLGLKSLWDKGWRFNQPGVGLWFEGFFFPGFLFSIFPAAGWWWAVLQWIQGPLHLFITNGGAKVVA